ncbi:molybdenum cofactor guanylyltransferase MobA [Leucothrix arctica]|uniref:Molybdenum cofactor guanylyltransferase n=1 Tax=Leucothrix arctica TaxID=1481894 RepID=A0A317CI11_9GAMM|nr:molybdenum cofactor guanylyltransferase MobA [Leucothrix arctica]PWQ95932.1 molybdenum cofactor guanylyltransferase [Leucothrix arctica]
MFDNVTVVVIAGGQGRRFGGQDKGLVEVCGKPLIEHILAQLKPYDVNVVISANRNLGIYKAYGYPVIGDRLTNFQGPLAGIASVMHEISTDYLVALPCDAVLIPTDFIQRLTRIQTEENAEIVVASDGKRIQPIHSLISVSLLPSLEAFLARGERKVDRWFAEHNMVIADFSDSPEAFHNFNTEVQKQQYESAQASLPEKKQQIVYVKPVLGFAAFSGTGKTTLLKQLLPLLNQRGLKVAMIKHAHHTLDVDHKGKDSYELRKAGAEQMLVVSRSQVALIQDLKDGRREPSLQESLAMLNADVLDMVLVEGFKQVSFPKIELHREGLNKPLLYTDDENIIAFASEQQPTVNQVPWLDLNNIEQIADFVYDWYQQSLT